MTIETTVYPPGRVGSNDTGPVRRTVLPNGLRIVTEVIPGVRSVAYGAWVGVGSRHEAAAQRGASHFLEHLLFKGTQRRDAMDIAKALDAVGGESNAITTKEYTCYYVRTRDADLPLAADLIGDMLTCARLDPAQVEAERRVILGELAMYEDDPGHAVQNLFAAALFGADDPLARPSAGDRESVLALSWEQIAAFYASRYRLGNVVVAAAGNVDHDEVVDLTSRGLSPDASVDGYSRPPASRPERREPGVRVLRRHDPTADRDQVDHRRCGRHPRRECQPATALELAERLLERRPGVVAEPAVPAIAARDVRRAEHRRLTDRCVRHPLRPARVDDDRGGIKLRSHTPNCR